MIRKFRDQGESKLDVLVKYVNDRICCCDWAGDGFFLFLRFLQVVIVCTSIMVHKYGTNVSDPFHPTYFICHSNTGMSWGAPLEEFPEKDGWDRLMATNTKRVFVFILPCIY